ncbi:MAG: glycosyltransferase, partial [Candidatus Gastranaerophilaceae bacterium]
QGGGVNIYQRNIIEYLIKNTEHEIYFISSGLKYNPLNTKTYIKKTKNIFGERCKSFEIINSSIMAPAFAMYMNPKKFIEDNGSYEIFDKFIKENGPFDVIHFNNIEGISINVLKLKEKYPNTKFIVSIHNYQPICPLVQYFQNHNTCICNDFNNGQECLKCSDIKPNKKEYYKRGRNFYYDKLTGNKKFLRLPFKLFCKFFKYRTKRYIGSTDTMKPEQYAKYRKHNVEVLNKYADYILAVSERVRQIMVENGCSSDKVITSYIGTKFAEHELKHSVAKTTKPFTIAYLGYERIDKGFFFLIDALSKLDKEIAKNINVVLAVAHIHKENYVDKLDNFNKVIVHNGYTHEKLPDILKDVNLGIVPVLWEDNLPQVAIEMVALGVPILCSSFGGASELCKSELFKFRGADEKDFLEKLTDFVKGPELLQEYWHNYSPLTTMKKNTKQLIKLYGE